MILLFLTPSKLLPEKTLANTSKRKKTYNLKNILVQLTVELRSMQFATLHDLDKFH